MASKIKVDQLETTDGSGTIALQNQLSGMTSTSMPAGSVLQVVSYGGSSRTTISSQGTWTATGLTLAITPSATSSKILALVTQPARVNGSTPMRGGFELLRGSTTVWNSSRFTEHMHVRNAPDEHDTLITFSHLDSPSTTSATTYTVRAILTSGTSMFIWEGNFGANIILMEIAG